jgi:putative ABC transport system substrate-binding protein
MPAMYYRREFVDAGGLASYGASNIDANRQAGVYVARVLKGDKPGELPVMQAAKFEFVLNLSADWQRQHDARREELKEWRAKAGLS